MNVETLTYAAEVFKFAAVSAAAFELVREERRRRIDAWLFQNLKGSIIFLAGILSFLYIAVFFLVNFSPYLILFSGLL